MSENKTDAMLNLTPRIEARQKFFAQPMPEGYAEEWAEILAQPLPEEQETTAAMLEFRIGELQLALASRYVKAVTAALTVCPVPHRNNTAFLGLVAFGGEVIPCVSLARILGAADAITTADARTIVVEERPGERWAFRVHAVLGVNTGSIHERTESDPTSLDREWSDSVFEDERKQRIDILNPETLFKRMQRATA
jgi:chemotaxis signal transduction protein